MTEESTTDQPEENEPAGEIEEKDEATQPKPNGKRRRIFVIGGAVLLVAALAGFVYWLYARQFESTDDAFIDGDVVQISPKVSAYVAKVYVESNQLVHKGDLLVELDTADLEVKLEKAKADLENARSQYQKAVASATLTQSSTKATRVQASSNVATTKVRSRKASLRPTAGARRSHRRKPREIRPLRSLQKHARRSRSPRRICVSPRSNFAVERHSSQKAIYRSSHSTRLATLCKMPVLVTMRLKKPLIAQIRE